MGMAGAFAYSVSADSTVTVPMPPGNGKTRGVTMTLRIPPNTEAITEEKLKRPTSRSGLIVWDPDPYPKIPMHDEYYEIVHRFSKKGWVKGASAQLIAGMRPVNRYQAVRLIEHILNNVLDLGRQKDLVKAMRISNINPTDIDDLRRMVNKFAKDLAYYGRKLKKDDKELLMISDNMKKSRTGVMRVIKVEGQGDGGTVIHLQVD